ncbi:hypothetical protein RI129_012912 [Pyrocoelia pectoralis]|uniref:Uncharacterized protein n=1 Tax=Pyrocoelia pectoralis TaxID=417401 RepID=A0AAN7ZCJ5_9COLE
MSSCTEMTVKSAILLFLLSPLISVNGGRIESLEYYWREYSGDIPFDAVPAGVDKLGNPTYIGQVYMQGFGLLPATITKGSNYATTSSQGRAIQTNENIKILCSLEQSKLKWIGSNIKEEQCLLVNGGSEANQIIHIGRANHEGEIIIGRVFNNWEMYKGLWIPYNGAQIHFTTYEVLTFDCNKR